VSCPSLTAPDNGMIQCSGSFVDDICVFTCDDGFQLNGSGTRTCQDDGTWSGTEAVCTEGLYCIIYCSILYYAFINIIYFNVQPMHNSMEQTTSVHFGTFIIYEETYSISCCFFLAGLTIWYSETFLYFII